MAEKTDHYQTAIGTNSVTGDLSTDGSKPLYVVQETLIIGPKSNNATTPSIYHDATAMVSKPECFDVVEIVNDVVKNSISKSPEKSEPAKQQNHSQSETNEANNQHENKFEGNSNHGKESQKDVHDNDAKKIDKTTDIVLTKENISLIVHDIVSQVEKLFANKF